MNNLFQISGYLAFKEIWRNRGRFLLISLVIALITLLVLFIAALGEGLGNGNREYISKLDAQFIVYQAKSDLLIPASRLGLERVEAIREVDGVADAGMLGTSSATIVNTDDAEPLKVALLGIEPGRPGEPKVVDGGQLSTGLGDEIIVDRNTALRSGLGVGDTVSVRTTQGTEEELFTLQVVGVTDGQQYSLQPAIFASFETWDEIRPKSEAEKNFASPVANVVLVKLTDAEQVEAMRQELTAQVENIDVATLDEAIQALPGYSAQQSTLNTQGGFTLIIGLLVIGGFFQIQILQKVSQIGVLKAIGTANPIVAAATILQIVMVTVIGVAIGGLLAFLFSLSFPPTVPIVFNGTTSAVAVIALLLIGPLGGLVSIRHAVRIEPLKALGLSS